MKFFKGLSWKNLLYSFLGFLCPLLFVELIKSQPDFPLGESDFTSLMLWLIGLLVGGWNIGSAAFKKLIYNKYGVNYEQWIKQ